MKVRILLMHIIDGGDHSRPVVPDDAAAPVRLQAVIRQRLSRFGHKHRQAVHHAVAKEQREHARANVDGHVLPGEARQTNRFVTLVGGDFAEILYRVLNVAQRAEILLIRPAP